MNTLVLFLALILPFNFNKQIDFTKNMIVITHTKKVAVNRLFERYYRYFLSDIILTKIVNQNINA